MANFTWWHASIYKVLWAELSVFFTCFYAINLFYRFYLSEDCDKKRFFIDIVKYCNNYGKDIPISFVLGFYVSIVVTRWWDQWMYLPWPDTLALTVSVCVDGSDDRGRLIRRTIMRYTNLCYVMAIKTISPAAIARFPTMVHLVEAGFLLEHERAILDELGSKTSYLKYWAPIIWAGVVARRARKEGKIKDDISLNNVIAALNNFRRGVQNLLNYDWVNVPLVYTQVVTLAVHMYFLSTMVGKQFVVCTGDTEPMDMFFPLFVFLEFFFYFGWLKVAECLINPYGGDDDDFEVNWMIDRYFQVSYVIVDEMHQEHPNLLRDQYWDEVFPLELPYTEAAAKFKAVEGQTGSAKYMEVKAAKAEFVKEAETKHGKYVRSDSVVLADTSNDSLADATRKDKRRRTSSIDGSNKGPSTSTSITSAAKRPLKGKKDSTGGYVRNSSVASKGIDVKALMEQDDVAYDPSQDELEDKKGK